MSKKIRNQPGQLLDVAGRNNSNLVEATQRITQGATWKKQRTIMLLPAGDFVPTRAALAWMSLIPPPNQGFLRWLLQGDEVGIAYSQAIDAILANPELSKWEYILTLEHDNLPHSDGLLKLIEAMDKHPEYDAIGGLYWTKGVGGVPQCWGDPMDPTGVINYRPQPPRPGQVMEVCGTGMGFTLFRMKMFRDWKGAKPYFQTKASKEGVGTQDLFFWGEARKQGHRCAVDCKVLVGHLDPSTGEIW
jgi:hypothetical protein